MSLQGQSVHSVRFTLVAHQTNTQDTVPVKIALAIGDFAESVKIFAKAEQFVYSETINKTCV